MTLDSASILAKISKYRLDYDRQCLLEQGIHQLLRQVTSLLLFSSNPIASPKSKLAPQIQHLLQMLREIYPDHSDLENFDTTSLIEAIAQLQDVFLSDIEAALINDPATDDPLEVISCYPGFKAIRYHRVAHILHKKGLPLLPRLTAELAHQMTGIDIHPGATIGASFFIDHGTGIVIGETAEIGQGVTLYQGVTLGAKSFRRDETGSVIKGELRHPMIGNGVTVYAGATILGRVRIGEHSLIGGNVWLTESVPAGSRVMQQRYTSSYFADGDGI